jgi:hypothetical protein
MNSLSIAAVGLRPASELTLHQAPDYRGLPMCLVKAPFVREYLEELYQTIQSSLLINPQIFAVRARLTFCTLLPSRWMGGDTEINRFAESFIDSLRRDRSRPNTRMAATYNANTTCFWGREYGTDGRPFYKVLLLMNNDAYFRSGNVRADTNFIRERIQRAWGRALFPVQQSAERFVALPSGAAHIVSVQRGLPELFYLASAMCRADNKCFGSRTSNIGSSTDLWFF